MHNYFVRRCLRVVVIFMLLASAPARADGVFDAIKKALSTVVDPDLIDMARFSIEHPTEAATVYYRAGIQDYPFFAMVGAVKAAKNRQLPGIGTFTLARCLTPVTAVDAVFLHADATISDAQGKAATSQAMQQASAIAAQYAQAGTAQAKQAALNQLSQSVPYFDDIPTICLFAFDTDFKAEKDVFKVANQISQDIRSAYKAFKSGDVVTGTSIMLTLGVSKGVVCSLVDSAVAGGMIGRTPLLGDLAKSACSGFVGVVLDGINGLVKGGLAVAEAGVNALVDAGQAVGCAVWSLIGSGCSSSPPPPSAMSQASGYCAPHGGLASLLSKTNRPDDYSVKCNDGSMCIVRPGPAPDQPKKSCATGAEIAANKAQRLARIEAEFQQKLPAWEQDFAARWLAQCPAENCQVGVKLVRLNASLLAKQKHQADPDREFWMLTYYIFEAAERQAADMVEDYRYRVLPELWAKGFLERGEEGCQDEVCRTAIRLVALDTRLAVRQQGERTPRLPYGAAAARYAAAEKRIPVLVAESVQRSAEFNKKTTAEAGAAWEILTNSVWGKQCLDAQCVEDIKTLSAKMRVAAKLLQMAYPNESSLKVQGMASKEYGPKFAAAVQASKQRVAARTVVIPPALVRAAPLAPWMQPVRFSVARTPYQELRATPSRLGGADIRRDSGGGRPAPVQPADPGRVRGG